MDRQHRTSTRLCSIAGSNQRPGSVRTRLDIHTQLSGRRLRPRRSQHTRLAPRPSPQGPRRHGLGEKQEAVQQAALEKRASELLVQSRTPARVGCDGYLRARQDHLGPAPHAVDEFLAKEPTLDLVATLAKSIVSYTCWIVTHTHTHRFFYSSLPPKQASIIAAQQTHKAIGVFFGVLTKFLFFFISNSQPFWERSQSDQGISCISGLVFVLLRVWLVLLHTELLFHPRRSLCFLFLLFLR